MDIYFSAFWRLEVCQQGPHTVERELELGPLSLFLEGAHPIMGPHPPDIIQTELLPRGPVSKSRHTGGWSGHRHSVHHISDKFRGTWGGTQQGKVCNGLVFYS